MTQPEQLRLLERPGSTPDGGDPDGGGAHGAAGSRRAAASAVCAVFEPARLIQGRRLAGLTKRAIAAQLGISASAVGQWETGTSTPRPDHVLHLGEVLDVPPEFFAAGRPYARLDAGAAHFRRLRSTPAVERARAVAFVQQVWEVAHALGRRVQLPPVRLPGFVDGELKPADHPGNPLAVARGLRRYWGLGAGPVPHLVRLLERNGLLVTLFPFAGEATSAVDAFSTSRLPRPVVVLTPDRARDVYRHRFTAAHELGHLLLHPDAVPGDPLHERQADAFAAEFLTPCEVLRPQLPAPANLRVLGGLSHTWGVSVESLVHRSRETGTLSDAACRRAQQQLAKVRKGNVLSPEPVSDYPGESPVLLARAFELARTTQGLTLASLSRELQIAAPRLRGLLGQSAARPRLKLV